MPKVTLNTKKEWFYKVIDNAYLKNKLLEHGVCLVPEAAYNHAEKFLDEYWNTYPLTKRQFTWLGVCFVYPNQDEMETSLNHVMHTSGIGGSFESKYQALYGMEHSKDFIDTHHEHQSKTKNPLRGDAAKASSHFCKEYWLRLGYSESDAIDKAISTNTSIERKPKIYHRNQSVLCKEYWMERHSYSEEDALIQIELEKDRVRNDLDSLVKRNGKDKGHEIHNRRVKKYKDSMTNDDGTWKAYGCYVSKESLKFLIPIYKWLRKNGIAREDIYWGIRGSKEYVLNDSLTSNVYMYDFCVPKLGIIIEYNGTAWHPMAPFDIGYRTIVDKFKKSTIVQEYENDKRKWAYAQSKNFCVFPIWCVESNKHEKVINFLKPKVEEFISV